MVIPALVTPLIVVGARSTDEPHALVKLAPSNMSVGTMLSAIAEVVVKPAKLPIEPYAPLALWERVWMWACSVRTSALVLLLV